MKYSIGIDFGTLSGRALLVEVETGREVATAVKMYSHAVMDEVLPDGVTKLPPDWALQHPRDYLEVLAETVPAVLAEARVDPADVVGVAVDFTACTMIPVLADGTPLCFLPEYEHEPHAYVKLWKHHAAQPEADKLNALAQTMDPVRLSRYGGKVSSEWLYPKAWQLLNEAPALYARADKLIEAGDWIVLMLTGNERRNACAAGYKAMWHKREGYPSKAFFRALDPRLENIVEEKLSPDVYALGGKAGEISEAGARLCGLLPGTAVGMANIDAHVAVPAAGITTPGRMLMIMGTSTCHMLLGSEEKLVPGTCGVVEDGIIGGLFGYEAGQSCVGDHFDWFVKNLVPASYRDEAAARGISIHKLLREKVASQKPGQSGLLALDWWNGNRSVLVDADLSGLFIGMSLTTKPEELYRALIEATAFGTRMIIDTFERYGVPVDELIAAGGIAEKDEMMMQIYADVTHREIRISGSAQACALGSAMFGAVAAGKAAGGYDTIGEAAEHMSSLKDTVYRPIPENSAIYDRLYEEYTILHDTFGRGANDCMKRLRALKREQNA
ncbi:MAG: ribulokinase [Oscillospiraceae bacterium]|nr:ribulokinase [Oscillospiraceae bacterium]